MDELNSLSGMNLIERQFYTNITLYPDFLQEEREKIQSYTDKKEEYIKKINQKIQEIEVEAEAKIKKQLEYITLYNESYMTAINGLYIQWQQKKH